MKRPPDLAGRVGHIISLVFIICYVYVLVSITNRTVSFGTHTPALHSFMLSTEEQTGRSMLIRGRATMHRTLEEMNRMCIIRHSFMQA